MSPFPKIVNKFGVNNDWIVICLRQDEQTSGGEWGVTLRHQSGLRDSGVLGRPALIWWVDLHRTPSKPLLQSAKREWGYNIFYNPSYSPSQDLEQGQRVNTISTSHYIISLSQRTWGERELKWDSVTENETHTYIWHHVLRHVQACLNHQKEYPDRLKPDTDSVIFFSVLYICCLSDCVIWLLWDHGEKPKLCNINALMSTCILVAIDSTFDTIKRVILAKMMKYFACHVTVNQHKGTVNMQMWC